MSRNERGDYVWVVVVVAVVVAVCINAWWNMKGPGDSDEDTLRKCQVKEPLQSYLNRCALAGYYPDDEELEGYENDDE